MNRRLPYLGDALGVHNGNDIDDKAFAGKVGGCFAGFTMPALVKGKDMIS